MARVTVQAEPEAISFDPARTAFVMIDFQRDFMEPGGFGETLGNDVSLLQSVVPPLKKVTCGHVLPPSLERATAISVPLMATPFPALKKTTMYE